MSRLDEARQRLSQARALLEAGSNASLQYAALELRQCIELLIYEKLESFAQYLPPSFLKGTWQPDKLLKAMRQLDPNADLDQSLALDYPVEESSGVVVKKHIELGEHKALKYRWLSDTYHKLGSRLHVSTSGKEPDNASKAHFLLAVAAEVEEALSSSIVSVFIGQISAIKCDVCQQDFGVSWHYLEKQPAFRCLNEKCEAIYRVDAVSAKKVDYKLWTATMTCATCGHQTLREARHLRDGLPWDCEQCRRPYVLKQWNLEAVPILPALDAELNGSEGVTGSQRITNTHTAGGTMNRRAKTLSIAGIAVTLVSGIALGFAILRPFDGLEYGGGTLNSLSSRTPEYAHWAATNDIVSRIGLILLVVGTVLQVAAVKVDD
jgi:hypothetical protein